MRPRHLLVVVLLCLSVGLSLGVSADVVEADTVSDEQVFISKINHLRQINGLAPLVVDGELTGQARGWAQVMAADQELKHTNSLSSGVTSNWTVLGENVGVHTVDEIDALFAAFVNSPAHLANLLDPRYQYVGVGVAYDANGQMWTTQRFMAVATAPAPAPSPAPTSEPALPPTSTPAEQPAPSSSEPSAPPPPTSPPTTVGSGPQDQRNHREPSTSVETTATTGSPSSGHGCSDMAVGT